MRTVCVGEVPVLVGRWFDSRCDAREWLDFDCSDEDSEAAAYSMPDHFAEWLEARESCRRR